MNSTEACLVRIQQSGHDMNGPSFRWSCRVQRSKSPLTIAVESSTLVTPHLLVPVEYKPRETLLKWD